MQLADFFHSKPSRLTGHSNWPELIAAASRNLILAAFWDRIQSLDLAPVLPTEIRQVLESAQVLNEERNDAILAETIKITKLLNSIGIRPVALKGVAYLLTGVYAGKGLRYLEDIDLLLPSSQLSRAITLLKRHGYLTTYSDPLAPLRHHAPTLQRPGAPPVELHHSLGAGACRQILSAIEVFHDASILRLDGVELLVPSPAHLATHLILHSQIHHSYRDRVFPALRSFYDLQRLTSSQSIDWDAVAEAFRSSGHYLTFAIHLKEAERILGLEPPVSVRLNLLGRMRWTHRRLLVQNPVLRLLDPYYLFLSLIGRRSRVLRDLVRQPKEWRCFIKALFGPDLYRNLLRI